MNIYIPYTRLPSEYQEVEYIESTGTQYINTGYKPTTYPKIDFTFLYVWGGISSETWLPLFWRRDYYWYGRAADFALFVTKASPYYLSPNRWWFDPWNWSWVTISKDIKYNIVIDKWQFYLDWVLKSWASTNNTITSTNYPVFLFDNNDGWSRTNRNTQIRLYSCKLYNDWVLERDLVPCYRKSDWVIWMYDLVNNQFYTNSWTGTFSKGNDVTMSEVKNIYIGEYKWGTRPSNLKWWYWELDGNMNDGSWNWHTGSWTSHYTTDRNGTVNWAYDASSSSYYVSIPNSSELYMTNGESFSFWFWIKPYYWIGTGSTYWVISMTQSIAYYPWWSIHNDSNSRNWQFRTRASWQSTVVNSLSALSFNANEWFHFVITYDGTSVKYYKNATLLWSFTYTVWDCSTSYPLTIWYASTWSATWYAAYDDTFYMKNYCLSKAEIEEIYEKWIYN